ncbi:hypothetical protein L1D05_24405 [Vibrio vulnificus]|nr:hypothetical protein [Vibrio vulnificus]
MIKSLCGSFCSACLHPLTRRYKLFILCKLLNRGLKALVQ